ncbi:unnamed protein product, partial [Polarella glacialis]
AHSLFAALGRPEPGTRVVDATAGFGSDALLMARCFGLRVTVVERNPLVFALLEDAACRAAETVAGGIDAVFGGPVLFGDATEVLVELSGRQRLDIEEPAAVTDIVYLDPMFPRERVRKSKPDLAMQVLAACASHAVGTGGGPLSPGGPEGGSLEVERALLQAARRCAGRHVVVKRASSSSFFAGVKPSRQHVGTTNRFDVYLPEASARV